MIGEPVRPDGAAEAARIALTANRGPYVAWRAADGTLHVHGLSPRAPATIGRIEGTVTFRGHRGISREHAEVTFTRGGEVIPASVAGVKRPDLEGSEMEVQVAFPSGGRYTVRLRHAVNGTTATFEIAVQ